MNSKKLALVVVALLLQGCVSLRDSAPVPTQYRIRALPAQAGDPAVLPYSIAVEKPGVVSWLNTSRIALTYRDGQLLDYYAGAQWSAQLDTVLEEFIVESLLRDFSFVAGSGQALSQGTDYKLTTRVLDYQAEYPASPVSGPPRARVTLVVTLVRRADQSVVTQLRVSDVQKAGSNTLLTITATLERLLQESFVEIQRSIRAQVAEDRRTARQ